ncbi:T9SS type A sorting domain-containing protein [candidate division KSB1 bacterium]|nr:T9SS type A sorting domain-containing protein [candidate division KSB1 bacterium]
MWKKIILSLSLMLFVVNRPLEAEPPDWNVNPTDFELTASMTAVLYFDKNLTNDGNNIVGVFVDQQCRGFASPTFTMNTSMYFITIYSNTSEEEMTLKAYIANMDSIFEIRESITFAANETYGSPADPYQLNIYFNYDFPPSISNIPGQTITIGDTFQPIPLDDYLRQEDDDSVAWSYSGNNQLFVSVSKDNIATLTPFYTNWTGADSVTFTVTEQTQNALTAEQSVPFTILPVDNPPEILKIPDQTIGLNKDFPEINLNDYLIEQDGDSVEWTYSTIAEAGITSAPDWDVQPAEFEMSMTITAKVSVRGEQAQAGNHLLSAFAVDATQPDSLWECRGVAEPVKVMDTWQYYLTIYSDTNGEKIRLRFYDAATDNIFPVKEQFNFESNIAHGSPIEPANLHAGYLIVSINDNNIARIDPADSSWIGSETIQFRAMDENTTNNHADSSQVMFTILPDHYPVVGDITDQIIEQGESFARFDLDNYLTEVDNEPVQWSFHGNNHLNVNPDGNNIVAITPVDTNWIGSESIWFVATDLTSNALSDSAAVTFSIEEKDYPPELSTIEDQVIQAYENFSPIDLASHLTTQDNDSVCFNYVFPSETGNDPSPSWTVRPSDYELSMTVTAIVLTCEDTTNGTSHLLAAFSGEDCRGVASATNVMGASYYFLTVYSNAVDETIQFKFYNDDLKTTFPVREELSFSANADFGSPLEPYSLNAELLTIEIEDNKLARVTIVDDQWTGSESVLFIARDVNTHKLYADSQSVNFVVQDLIPVELSGFSATVQGNTVHLNWKTETESNNYGFHIQRKTTASDEWETIDFIGGCGTSATPHEYTFEDSDIDPGQYSYRLKQVDYDGSATYSHEISVNVNVPSDFSLSANFPNPFNPGTTIRYSLPAGEHRVDVLVYDIAGKLIKALVNDRMQQAGYYQIRWDGTNSAGNPVASGTYFYRFSAGSFTKIGKMVLVK